MIPITLLLFLDLSLNKGLWPHHCQHVSLKATFKHWIGKAMVESPPTKTLRMIPMKQQGPMQVPKSKLWCLKFKSFKGAQPGWTTRIYPVLFIWLLKLHCGLRLIFLHFWKPLDHWMLAFKSRWLEAILISQSEVIQQLQGIVRNCPVQTRFDILMNSAY